MSVHKNVSFLSLPYKGHYNQILYAKKKQGTRGSASTCWLRVILFSDYTLP